MLDQLRSRLAALRAKAQKFQDTASAEERDLTDEEVTSIETLVTECQGVARQIAALNSVASLEAAQASPLPRRTTPSQPNGTTHDIDDNASITGGEDRQRQDPSAGFRSMGEYLQAVVRAGSRNPVFDSRLSNIQAAAPSTVGTTQSGADGAFAIPEAFRPDVTAHDLPFDDLLSRTDNTPIGGNTMLFPRDETTPWGSTGVNAYWASEGGAATASKPVIGQARLQLHELIALVPLTNELVHDATALASHVNNKMPEAIRWKVNDAIFNGTGAGQPQGVFTAGATVTQAMVAAQAADTIVAENIGAMWSRLTTGSKMNAVWLITPDATAQLTTMTIGDQPAFQLPNGLQDAPFGRLMGRPVIETEVCQTLGDLGDIALCDFSQYLSITSSAGMELAESAHLYFDANAHAFRAVFRVDGQPWNTAPVTPPNSSLTRSGFVLLAARA